MPKFLRLGNQLVLFAFSLLGAISVRPVTTYNDWLITICWSFAAASLFTVVVILFGPP